MKRAENLGVRIKTGIEVQQVNFQVPFVKFTTGGELDADIIIAADGSFPAPSTYSLQCTKFPQALTHGSESLCSRVTLLPWSEPLATTQS